MNLAKWLQKRKQKAKDKLYVSGFDYAIGAMVRGEKTPLELNAGQWEGDRNHFDVGVDSAIDYAVQHELIKDDRIR